MIRGKAGKILLAGLIALVIPAASCTGQGTINKPGITDFPLLDREIPETVETASFASG